MTERLLHRTLEKSAQRVPDKEALKHEDRSLSYAGLLARAKEAAAALLQVEDTRAGDRVAIIMEKSLEQAVWIYASSMANRVFVLINDQLKPNQVEHILRDCGVRVLVYSGRCAETAASAIAASAVVSPATLAGTGGGASAGTGAELPGVRLLKADAKADPAGLPASRAICDDIATIIYTSGSTGLPKGIVITHRNLLDGIDSVSEYLGIHEHDRLLGLLPFNFDYGLNQLTSALAAGASVVLHQFFLPATMLALIEAERITGLAAIPTVWASVFNPKLVNLEKLAGKMKYSSLRYITNSGGKLPVPVVRQIRKLFPGTSLFLMYGLTEAFRSTFLNPAEVDSKPESMGKAIPGVEIEVVREDGTPCAPDEPGELIHRGALIARGYWNNPAKTAEVYRPNPLLPDGNGFLETVVYSGDLVKKDKDGYLYYIGRKDNMIKISGYRVSPTEVEELLASSGLVAESVVFGVPDDDLGYRIKAVVAYKGKEDPSALLEHCRKTAPSYLVPRELATISAFPKTASGKIDRPGVMKEYGDAGRH